MAIAYELSRHEHVQNREHVSQALGELKDELARIEAKLGGERINEVTAEGLPPVLKQIEGLVEDAGPVVGDQIKTLMQSVERIARELNPGQAPAPGQ